MLRGSSPRSQRWCPAGLIPQALPSPAQIRFPVSQRGYRVIAAPQAGNHIIHVTPAHTVTRQPAPMATTTHDISRTAHHRCRPADVGVAPGLASALNQIGGPTGAAVLTDLSPHTEVKDVYC